MLDFKTTTVTIGVSFDFVCTRDYYVTIALHVDSEICLAFIVKLLQDSTSENKIILIGVIVILCISVAVNGCTITW